MGFNHKVVGYADVQTMVKKFDEGIKPQLDAVIAFIKANSQCLKGLKTNDYYVRSRLQRPWPAQRLCRLDPGCRRCVQKSGERNEVFGLRRGADISWGRHSRLPVQRQTRMSAPPNHQRNSAPMLMPTTHRSDWCKERWDVPARLAWTPPPRGNSESA